MSMNRRIADWTDAYANGPHIPAAETFPPKWEADAAGFRQIMDTAGRAQLDMAYGDAPRNRLDLFLPETTPAGLVVFVHGGYWRSLDKSVWSHLARGSVAAGHACALPAYTLCPQASIADITREIAAAITVAAETIDGPIRLAGHSAGGHLVTRMLCGDTPLPKIVLQRIAHTMSISGVHDLRPLLKTAINDDLRLDMQAARAESPALHEPLADTRVTCWVGADERPEFLRQNRLLAEIWQGFDVDVACVEEAGRHHFDIVEGLCDPAHPMLTTLLT
jgi:arylformamidase